MQPATVLGTVFMLHYSDMAADRIISIVASITLFKVRGGNVHSAAKDIFHKVDAMKENLRNTPADQTFSPRFKSCDSGYNIVPGRLCKRCWIIWSVQRMTRELIERCEQLDVEFEKYHAAQQDKTLYLMTVVTSIFLPAQFLTGVWGMNFDDMPELKKAWGYPLFWVLCITMTTALLIHFRCGRSGY